MVLDTQEAISDLNPEYNWTKTTALTLNPAIELAREGKNVLVMAYGKHREHQYRDTCIDITEIHNVPGCLKMVGATAALLAYADVVSWVSWDMLVNGTPFFNGFHM